MIEVKYTGDALWDRIERAVEKVKDRLRRVTRALNAANIPIYNTPRRKAQRRNAPTGQTEIAQGNALGTNVPPKPPSPNGPTGRTYPSVMLPRRGMRALGVAYPGQRPGLSQFVPLAHRLPRVVSVKLYF